MSDQPPLTPPSPPGPAGSSGPDYSPYDAPAYGDVAPDAPTLLGPGPGGTPPPPPAPGAYQQNPYQPGVGQAPYQMAPGYAFNPAAQTHPLAITSLVLGIVGIAGIVLTPVILVSFITAFCSPFAIWLGVRSKREIKSNPHAFAGEGLATGGLVTGIIGSVLAVLGLLLILLFVALFAAIIGGSTY